MRRITMRTTMRASSRGRPTLSTLRKSTAAAAEQRSSTKAGRSRRRAGVVLAVPDYCGPQLPVNCLRLNPGIKTVRKVTVGQSHMLVQCHNTAQQRELVYGVGRNMWGQLGQDPT